MKSFRKTIVVLVSLVFVISINLFSKIFAFDPKKEVRAVWIATVCNINWPKTKGAENQKQEMIEILDVLKDTGINRVYFQVRCRCDAMYESQDFPWSQWLTGELGTNPGYDPLLFMKEECQKRGIILEAWINPFLVSPRGDFDCNSYLKKLPDNNPLKQNLEWIVKNENGWHMLNPGIPEVRDLIIKEATYIVKKYQLPIHMDDYFYPYPKDIYFPYKSFPIPKAKERFIEYKFDDEKEYKIYGKDLSLQDFRRENINEFVESLNKSIKSVNPKLGLSVSPFAIWKNSVEEGGCDTDGMESYYRIYTDTVKWVKNGWVDYIVPQIYWHIGFELADYASLAKWWNKVVEGTNVKLVIGQAGYRLDPESSVLSLRTTDEVINQINLNRSLKNVSGQSIFSLNCIKLNTLGIRDEIKRLYS